LSRLNRSLHHNASLGRGDRRKSRGQSLVEFAIIIPVFAALLILTVDIGRVYMGWVTLNNVARIGANFAAMNPTAWQGSGDAAVQARYQALMGKDSSGIDCTMPGSPPNPSFITASPNQYNVGSKVQVQLTCSFSLITPFVADVIGDHAGHISVSATSVFTIRSGAINGTVISGSAVTPTPSPTSPPRSGTTA